MNLETAKIIQFIKEDYGLDISMYDDSFLEKTIKCRMAAASCETGAEYSYFLANSPDEPTVLIGQLGNSYSEFFRNPLTFAYLEQVIFPMLFEKKKISKEKEVRIWSAACASGQEAYSLAILCDELTENAPGKLSYRIFATDINPEELANARKGIYPPASLNKVTQKRLQTYFTPDGEAYRISPKLSNCIDFSVFDLLSNHCFCPPASIYGNFDLIFCSNLLFYFKPEFRKHILSKAFHCLSPAGYLVTGESEREIVKKSDFREVFAHSAIFQKI
jgi:chemotaxis protein methyltransferase CheR